jgi:hypothetical protein
VKSVVERVGRVVEGRPHPQPLSMNGEGSVKLGSRSVGVCVVVAVMAMVAFSAAPAAARRAPGPGGTVVVSVPAELVPAVVEAHVFAPVLVPRGGESGAATPDRTPLVGAEHFSSSVLDSVDVDASGRRWTLVPRAPPAIVADAVARCLGRDRKSGKSDARPGREFAALALRAAQIDVDVDVDNAHVVVTFAKPVFVLPELLAHCPLRAAGNAPTGAYAANGPGRLAWRSGSFDAPPLLGAIEVRAGSAATGAGNVDRADVVVNPTALADNGSAATQLSPWPDVVVLVQGGSARDADPFGLADEKLGTRAFRTALRADLLAAAWASGRGGPTEALLPPGVAPARPLPPVSGLGSPPLSLLPVADNAEKVAVRLSGGADVVVDGVAERLAVLLRARGRLLDLRRGAAVDVDDAGIELVRWHPPTSDAALALLSFLGERPALMRDPAVARALDAAALGALLGKDPAARLAAALALERALLDARRVVPLLVVDRFLVVDPDLRGVVVRNDGVPLLDGAWWAGAGGAR